MEEIRGNQGEGREREAGTRANGEVGRRGGGEAGGAGGAESKQAGKRTAGEKRQHNNEKDVCFAMHLSVLHRQLKGPNRLMGRKKLCILAQRTTVITDEQTTFVEWEPLDSRRFWPWRFWFRDYSWIKPDK